MLVPGNLCSERNAWVNSRDFEFDTAAAADVRSSGVIGKHSARPPMDSRWSLMVLNAMRVFSDMLSVRVSLLIENPRSTAAWPCDNRRRFCRRVHRLGHRLSCRAL